MQKLAQITAQLEPHQERVRQRMKTQDGLVVAHGLGSGKTLSSIAAMDDVSAETRAREGRQAKIRALTPAALKANMQKEVVKHTDGGVDADLKLDSHSKFTRTGQPEDESLDLLVVDEAHRARSVGSKLKDQLKGTDAKKRMLLTATPVYNHPYEIGPLVNIAAGRYTLPETKGEFESKFVGREKVWPKGLKGLAYRLQGGTPGEREALKVTPELRQALRQWVDYHETDQNDEDFPRLNEHRVDVAMSKDQEHAYRYMMRDLPPDLQKKVKANLPPSKQEASKLMAFLNGPRQVANSTYGFSADKTHSMAGEDSAKIQEIVKRIKEKQDTRRLIYSNYVETGINPLRAQLDAAGVPYGAFTGSESKKDRKAAIEAYNEGKLNTLLVSSAGGEGLDLKGTREVHVMEPHWNEQKINQVIGRARRYGSHSHLSPEERSVDVYRYLSRVPKRGPVATPANAVRRWMGKPVSSDDSADHYIQNRSLEKQELNDQMMKLLKTGSAKTVLKSVADLQKRAPSSPAGLNVHKNIDWTGPKSVKPPSIPQPIRGAPVRPADIHHNINEYKLSKGKVEPQHRERFAEITNEIRLPRNQRARRSASEASRELHRLSEAFQQADSPLIKGAGAATAIANKIQKLQPPSLPKPPTPKLVEPTPMKSESVGRLPVPKFGKPIKAGNPTSLKVPKMETKALPRPKTGLPFKKD